MTKSLGQVAYEAFGSGTPRDPPWPKLWKQEQKWWQAAAEAAVDKDRRSYWRGASDAERKVIEAAKAWLHEQIHDPNSVRNVTCQYTKGALGLTLAIEALQEVEGD